MTTSAILYSWAAIGISASLATILTTIILCIVDYYTDRL